MFRRFVFCHVLFISWIYGNSSTVPNSKLVSNNTLTSKEILDNNSTKIKLPSEGGIIMPSVSTLTLPKENHTNLINLDKELGKTKERPVVPRKGVNYVPFDDNDSAFMNSTENKDNDIESHLKLNNTIPKVSKLDMHDASKVTEKKLNKTQEPVTIPHKPQVLSYEALSEMDRHMPSDQPVVMPSSKTHIVDQIPNPGADVNMKVQVINSRHPGMIMPIVITILTVPLFAVLGYMALRRGQEAWKNRHYKRMDFLLDGMYND